jgi:hypothetical protein
MPAFRILARYAEYCELIIEANTKQEARKKASTIEYGKFYELEQMSGFELVKVTPSEEPCDQ